MTKTNKSNSVKLTDHFQVERLGLAAGAAALFASTAYMNVSSWIAQADTTAQGVANGYF
ncbi:MAG: hypothetical protein AAFR11_09160 [Pseudomonadota bacterium]